MIKVYSFPENETESKEFSVLADGQKIKCHEARVSAHPINQVWPGYQRPIDQSELTSFITFGADGEVKMSVECDYPTDNVIVRPKSKNIKVEIVDGKAEFTLPGQGQYVLEYGSKHNVLHIFVNPVKDFGINEENENVIYFGEGVTYLEEKFVIGSNTTVYVDEGAVVYGSFGAENAENIRIIGYGIIDSSNTERGNGTPLMFKNCKNVYVEGVIVRDAPQWTIHFADCDNCVADNIKLIGMWRYNSDGCDFTNSTNCVLRNSFLRNFDDCIVIKGLAWNDKPSGRNIYVDNCVTWCDWGKNVEIGAETSADEMTGITIRNCDCIRLMHQGLDLQHGDRAKISNVLFDDIRLEYEEKYDRSIMQSEKDQQYEDDNEKHYPPIAAITTVRTMYSKDDHTGEIDGVTFRNISVTTENDYKPRWWIERYNGVGEISNVVIENYTLNGEKIAEFENANIEMGSFADKSMITIK